MIQDDLEGADLPNRYVHARFEASISGDWPEDIPAAHHPAANRAQIGSNGPDDDAIALREIVRHSGDRYPEMPDSFHRVVVTCWSRTQSGSCEFVVPDRFLAPRHR